MVPREYVYSISDILDPSRNKQLYPGTPSFQNAFSDGIDPAVVGGGIIGANLKNLGSASATAYVKESGDIQAALNRLQVLGGGTLILGEGTHTPSQIIRVWSNIRIIGQGKDKTIIDFASGAFNMQIKGTAAAHNVNNTLENLTLKASAGVNLDLAAADFFRISNVRVTGSTTNHGITVQDCTAFLFENVRSDNNALDGIYIYASASGETSNFTLLNCRTDSNTSDGLNISRVQGDVFDFTVIGHLSKSNTSMGIRATNGGDLSDYGTFTGCISEDNGSRGFEIEQSNIVLLGCKSVNNTSYGFEITDSTAQLIGCHAAGNSDDYRMDTGAFPLLASSFGAEYEEDFDKRLMQNASGGTLNAYEVVVYKGTADGNEVTTTTTQGDDKVVGVVAEQLSNLVFGDVLFSGQIDVKVNGVTDIAVGDFLCTHTDAGIAMKASDGDMAFAIALEAYSTDDSNGVISCVVIKPRKIGDFTGWAGGSSITTVGTVTSGNVDAVVSAASDTTAGKIEVATIAETNTGTDATRAVSPDGLAGSNFGIRYVAILCFDYGTDCAIGDGKGYFHIPAAFDGMNLISVHAESFTAGTGTGSDTMDIQIHNVDNALDMLSTKLTIDEDETGSDTAATAAVINTSNDHVNTNDVIRIDVDAVTPSTAHKGLLITMGFQRP